MSRSLYMRNTIHIPATSFMLLCWSSVVDGHMQKNLPQQKPEEEYSYLVNIDVNVTQKKKNAVNMFVRPQDKHNALWWETLNVNITAVCLQETSMGHV